MQSTSLDWEKIKKKLPLEKTKEGVAKRNKLFNSIDMNGNGYLSLAEVDRGIRDCLGLDKVFNCKSAIMRAFQAAKDKGPKRSKIQ
jgi:hypothetical protein